MDNHNKQDYYNRKIATKYTQYVVREPDELMSFIMKAMHGISRTRTKELLAHKMVLVDKQITTRHDTPLKKGQIVQILKKSNIHEFNHKLIRIVYEDAFIIVVEKMNGILTSSPAGQKLVTVKKVLDEYVGRQKKGMRVHTVHRLDRETSGLLIFAKNIDIQQTLVRNWREIVTDRRYIAVVQGEMEKNKGVVSSWLMDNKMFITYSSPTDNGGKLAITNYRTIKRSNGFSLVEMILETGRKNQIRVHMQDLKHPIVGDYKYGSTVDPIGRIALHAYMLRFYHPITGELMNFELPCPSSFNKIFQSQENPDEQNI